MIVTNDYNFSSNIIEVIRTVLNFFFVLYDKISQAQKGTKPLTANKNKKCISKHLRGKKLLIHLVELCAFTWFCFYAFNPFSAFSAFLCFFVLVKSYH